MREAGGLGGAVAVGGLGGACAVGGLGGACSGAVRWVERAAPDAQHPVPGVRRPPTPSGRQ
ncbi:hypothetical protein [Leucobacter aridicollis]|uniref:hypothetical protein n=1 Tax=Leucobacter aridicollis TaxID=283878 RepID=UPI0037C88568